MSSQDQTGYPPYSDLSYEQSSQRGGVTPPYSTYGGYHPWSPSQAGSGDTAQGYQPSSQLYDRQVPSWPQRGPSLPGPVRPDLGRERSSVRQGNEGDIQSLRTEAQNGRGRKRAPSFAFQYPPPGQLEPRHSRTPPRSISSGPLRPRTEVTTARTANVRASRSTNSTAGLDITELQEKRSDLVREFELLGMELKVAWGMLHENAEEDLGGNEVQMESFINEVEADMKRNTAERKALTAQIENITLGRSTTAGRRTSTSSGPRRRDFPPGRAHGPSNPRGGEFPDRRSGGQTTHPHGRVNRPPVSENDTNARRCHTRSPDRFAVESSTYLTGHSQTKSPGKRLGNINDDITRLEQQLASLQSFSRENSSRKLWSVEQSLRMKLKERDDLVESLMSSRANSLVSLPNHRQPPRHVPDSTSSRNNMYAGDHMIQSRLAGGDHKRAQNSWYDEERDSHYTRV